MTDEKNDVHVWEVLLDKACEIASEFEIEASRHRVVVRQRNIVYYPVDNTSDYWRLSLYLNCLLGLFRGRTIISSSKQRGAFFSCFFVVVWEGGASYNNPASLLYLTPEIVDRLFNAYQTDLPRKVNYVLCG